MTPSQATPEQVVTVHGMKERRVARPLKVLVPLIKNELVAGDAAGLEHYRQAGEMLKSRMAHGRGG